MPEFDTYERDTQTIRQLTAELAICKRERTLQAQMCVRLEDELEELKEERQFLIEAIQHGYIMPHDNCETCKKASRYFG